MRELVWVDRGGRVMAQIGSPQPGLATPALSPEGRRVAYSARIDNNRDIWIRDLQNNTDSRLTFDAVDEIQTAWFPAGRRVAYTELHGLSLNRIASRNADGSGERQELAAGMSPAVSQNGRFVLSTIDERGSLHLRYSELSADGSVGPASRVFKNDPEPSIRSPSLAPDGHFLAYEQGQPGGGVEVFMTKFPTGEGRWQISRGGGTVPVWARDTGELFFISGKLGGPKSLMASSIRLTPDVAIGAPLKLFDIPQEFSGEFDVSPDAKRFIMVRQRKEAPSERVRWVLVQNWLAEVAHTR
jgi:Tol biopolymer transport system component